MSASTWSAEDLVAATTDTLAPILLPTIEALGGLMPEDFAQPANGGPGVA